MAVVAVIFVNIPVTPLRAEYEAVDNQQTTLSMCIIYSTELVRATSKVVILSSFGIFFNVPCKTCKINVLFVMLWWNVYVCQIKCVHTVKQSAQIRGCNSFWLRAESGSCDLRVEPFKTLVFKNERDFLCTSR